MAKSRRATHKFTASDVATLDAKGYALVGVSPIDLPAFMTKYYNGFDLARWISEIEGIMIPHALTPVDRIITVSKDSSLQVQFENQFTSEDDALIFDRKFFREKGRLKVSHEYLVFPAPSRNKGHNKQVQLASLQHYKAIGVKSIEVIAGLSAGAYVWARHGFVAVYREEMKQLLARAKKLLLPNQFKIVERIYDAYYTKHPQGEEFPISRWADLPFMEKNVLKGPQMQ